MSTSRNGDDAVAVGKKLIAETADTKFPHLCLYNSLSSSGDTADGIEALLGIYENLLALHGFMAGFQYIALEGQPDLDENGNIDALELLIFSFRYFGFLVSLGGTLICIITAEYLKCIQQEPIETQVKGILRYAYFMQCADYSAILATFVLGSTVNVLLWKSAIPYYLAIAFNAICVFFVLLLLKAFFVIIFQRQKSRLLYDDPDFIAAQRRQKAMSVCAKLRGTISLFAFLWNGD